MKHKNRIRASVGSRVFDVAVVAIVAMITLMCFYPMVYVLAASFSDPVRLMNNRGPILLPLGWSLGGYEIVLKNPNTWVGYRNTAFYVLAGTALNMLMTTMGAYALSRPDFKGKKAITFFIVFTMYFSGGLIPNFLLVKDLKMLDRSGRHRYVEYAHPAHGVPLRPGLAGGGGHHRRGQ